MFYTTLKNMENSAYLQNQKSVVEIRRDDRAGVELLERSVRDINQLSSRDIQQRDRPTGLVQNECLVRPPLDIDGEMHLVFSLRHQLVGVRR